MTLLMTSWFVGFHYASIKAAQVDVQKCITWLKKSDKGKKEWEKVCMDYGLNPRKLNTPVKMRYVKNFHPFFFPPHVGFLLVFFLLLVCFPWLIHYLFKWIFSLMALFSWADWRLIKSCVVVDYWDLDSSMFFSIVDSIHTYSPMADL